LSGGLIVLILAGLMASVILKPNAPETKALPPLPESGDSQADVAWQVVEKAMACPDWQTALPFMRHPERISPVMERYHKVHPWRAFKTVKRRSDRLLEIDGMKVYEFTGDLDISVVTLNVVETSHGFRLDWDTLANAPKFEWDEFYAKPPVGEVRRLRGRITYASVVDSYYLEAGFEPSKTVALRLYATEPGDSVVALLPKDSPIVAQLSPTLSWQIAVSWVVDLVCVAPTMNPPRVELRSIVQKGWVMKD
jgi:hypothetical protein